MDEFSSIIQSKMSKLENLCSDLTKEIIITLQFISCLKKNFAEIVGKLNSITEPELFLKEFMDVHSFILKYQSFLTEVNCKFEILEMSEMKTPKLMSSNKALTSMPSSGNNSDIIFNLEIFRNLSLTKDNTVVKKIPSKQLSNSNVSNVIKPSKSKSKKKSKAKKTSVIESSNKCVSTSSSTNSEKNQTSDHNPEKSCLPVKTVKAKKLMDALEKKNVHDISLVPTIFTSDSNSVNTEKSGSSSNVTSCSKISSSSTNSLNVDDKKKIQKKPSSNVSVNSKDFDIDNNSLVNIQLDDIKSPVKDVTKMKTVIEETGKSNFSEEPLNENEENEIEPPNIEKQLGKEYDVVIEHIKSPSEFYVSVINSQPNLLAELEKNLKSLPENKKIHKTNDNSKACISKEIGNYALFYSKCDEMWYRAKIINWCLNLKDDYVSIFLIDYGEYKCVSIEDLQPMPQCYKKYPACTQRCHLFGVFPMDKQENSKTLSWGKESTEKMKYLTENSRKVRIKIAPDDCYHIPTSLPVTVWLIDQDNQCVNEMLVKSKYALKNSDFDKSLCTTTETSKSKFIENDKLGNWNPMKEDFESYKNSYELDINDPSAHIYGYVGKDYDRICSNFAKTGYCYKGQACRKEHQKLNPLGFTTDQEEVYNNAFNSLKVPPLNSILNVQITCLVTYNRFCCISDSSSFSFDEEDLQSLLKFMNKPENVLQMKKLLIPPSTGQIVIARYSKDRSWYRARILDSEPEKDLYRIVFVDYGNKEVVPLSDIRAIEARYLHLPFQAMQCFISGIDQNPKVPINEVMDYIKRRLINGNARIEVVARLPGEDVTLLVNIFDENGRNVGSDLIEEEYVLHKQEMIISFDNASRPG